MSASQKPIVVGERFTPLATFSGLKRVPFLAVSRNSLMASLVIGQDALAIRVIRLHVLRFEDIEAVSCGQRLGVSIQFSPKRGIRTFSANFRSKDPAAKTVLRRLAAAGVLLEPARRRYCKLNDCPEIATESRRGTAPDMMMTACGDPPSGSGVAGEGAFVFCRFKLRPAASK